MKRLTIILTLALGCSPTDQSAVLDDETSDDTGQEGGPISGGTSTAGTSSGSDSGTSSSSTTGATGVPSSEESGDPGDESGSAGSESGGEAGEPCSPGSHACSCYAGQCIGDLICGDGNRCWEPGECQGVDGTDGCPCVNDACFGDLQCWHGTCVASCSSDPDNDDKHCGGTCGNACELELGVGGCAGGECQPTWSECIYNNPVTNCNQYCESIGKKCAYLGCDGATTLAFGTEQSCVVGHSGTPTDRLCTTNLSGYHGRCCCE